MIFFPHLYNPDRPRNSTSNLSQDNLRILYDSCIRPTLAVVAPEQLCHWPFSYDLAMQQYRDVAGQLHVSSIQLAATLLAPFTEQLIANLNHYPQFRDAFFCHEWRGLKGATAHHPTDAAACDRAIDYICADLDLNLINVQNWWIDVAVEVFATGHILQWRKDQHAVILAFCAPEAHPDLIMALPQSRHWHEDLSSQIYSLAGFRATMPAAITEASGVSYVNIYTTDKSSTYQLHSGSFRRHRASELLPDPIGRLLKDVDSLGLLFHKLGGQADGAVQEGSLRAEGRINIDRAADYMRRFPPDPLFATFTALPAAQWW